MKIARPIRRVIEAFERLPGIGPKTAARLTYQMLHMPDSRGEEFAQALSGPKKDTTLCLTCFNVGESDPCDICTDQSRDASTICVVEQPLDLIAIENTNKFNGLYHVLHGVIDPLHHIGPDDIYLPQLLSRIHNPSSMIHELILALNPTMEGDATAMYISNQLKSISAEGQKEPLKITRLAQGLPLGGDLEYADSVTLSRALEGRR
jgi:recombination protein RecR